MKTQIWMVIGYYPYESDEIRGIYSSEKLAMDRKVELEKVEKDSGFEFRVHPYNLNENYS
jgi:hypothetical protein